MAAFERARRALGALMACALLWGCSALPAPEAQAPPDDLAARYALLGEKPGRVLRMQPGASRIRIYVFRGGRAPGLGHNHVLSAPQFEGYAYLPEQGLNGAQMDLVFRLDALALDLPGQRAEAGAAFASTPSEAAIAATRANMLGDGNMQAGRFPLVHLHLLSVSGEAPLLSARVAMELHGQSRELQVPLTVTGLPQTLQASGALVLRQSDFGITPFSVMAGLLAVQDEVRLEFSLLAQ